MMEPVNGDEKKPTEGQPEPVSAAPVEKKPQPAASPVPRENDYDWGRTLGEGTFGTVKLGTVKTPGFVFPVATGKSYAVKLIQKKFIMEKKKNKDIVFRERKILDALRHPFVVALHYTFQTDSHLYFIMDYCANGELYDHIRKLGSLSVECARWYLAEIVVAVEHIHARGIVHRDLKPENILLNEDWHIKVIDFGTAKEVGRGRANSFEGTPEYMSPELLLDKECDVRGDLWALGVMLFQFITGKLPFRGTTVWETMRKVREREFEPFPDFFPPLAKDLCEKLLVSNPDERLGSNGFEEIKSHPFFEGIDWDNIITTAPPPLQQNPAVPKPPEPAVRRTSSSALPNLDEEVEVEEAEAKPAKRGLSQSSPALSPSSSSDNLTGNPADVEANTAAWREFLKDSEKVVRTGLLNKKRRAFNVKKRQLILTDGPRMIYVDPSTRKEMGQIAYDTITKIVLKNPSQFVIHTKKRDYTWEDKTKHAQQWVEAITPYLNNQQQ